MSVNALGRMGFQQIMRLAKESVTRRSRVVAYDSNDDVSYTNTDTTISVVVQIVSLDDIEEYGGIDGGHHKQWLLDQVVRFLTDNRYESWVTFYQSGEDGPDTYEWDTGIAP